MANHCNGESDRSVTTVRRWFKRGANYRRPQPADLHHLALMDFLLEHYEQDLQGLAH